MRPYVLSDNEKHWSGFNIDLNAQELLPLFERLGLKARVTDERTDPATVHESWDECSTIVTANEADFIRYMLEHSKRDSGKICLDGWGLLVVRASSIVRARMIPKIKHGVPVNGKVIPWAAAAYANLCVSLNANGSIGVRRFRRCVHCERDTPIKAEWYKNIPEIRPRKARLEKQSLINETVTVQTDF